MKLVIDSNCFFAAFIKDGGSRQILLYKNFSFFTPEEFLIEFEKYRNYLSQKAHLQPKEFESLSQDLLKNVTFVSLEKYQEEFHKSYAIMEPIDVKDAPFLGIALALQVDGIWSNDKHFLDQQEIKVFSTKVLLDIIHKDQSSNQID